MWFLCINLCIFGIAHQCHPNMCFLRNLEVKATSGLFQMLKFWQWYRLLLLQWRTRRENIDWKHTHIGYIYSWWYGMNRLNWYHNSRLFVIMILLGWTSIDVSRHNRRSTIYLDYLIARVVKMYHTKQCITISAIRRESV